MVFSSFRPSSALILFCASVLAGCYSRTAVYQGAPVHEENGIDLYNQPRYDYGISWFGWTTIVGLSAAAAYGTWKGQLPLSVHERVNQRRDTSYFWAYDNGSPWIAAGATFLTSWIVTAIVKPKGEAVTTATVGRWAEEIDRSRRLVPRVGDTAPGTLASVRLINPGAESSFVLRSAADARLFTTLFPGSTFTDSVVLRSLPRLSDNVLQQLDTAFPDDGVRLLIRRAGAERTTTFSAFRAALDSTPALAEDRAWTAREAARRVRTPDDGARFVALVGASDTASVERMLDTLLPRLRPADVGVLRGRIGAYPRLTDAGRRIVGSAASPSELMNLAEGFPELRDTVAARLAFRLERAHDMERFLAAFPESQYAAAVADRLERVVMEPEMLAEVNSYYSEISPVIAPDGLTLYFVRKYHPGNTGGTEDADDIWVARLGTDGVWSKPETMPVPPNSYGPTSVCAVTPDGNTLLIGGLSKSIGGFSRRTVDGWTEPELLRIDNYYNSNGYYSAHMTDDGNVILMSIERKDTRGERDIYATFRREDGSWTAPRNLGATVNTRGDDDSPFIASDGRTLYYSSQGQTRQSNEDIWMTRRLDDTWQKWSKPVRLPSPINTQRDEAGLFIPASGRYVYFTSTRSGERDLDIYRVALPNAYRPNPVVLVAGRVLEAGSGTPLTATVIYEDLSTGREIGRATSDPRNGVYKITLPSGVRYGVRAELEGYVPVNDNLDLTQLRDYQERNADLTLVPLRHGERVRINNLFFDFGRADLRSESYPELNRLADLLRSTPALRIDVQGHTDNVGEEQRNQSLSEARAGAVVAYLVGRGVAAERMSMHGFGARAPEVPNDSEEGRQRNRRVEFVIVE